MADSGSPTIPYLTCSLVAALHASTDLAGKSHKPKHHSGLLADYYWLACLLGKYSPSSSNSEAPIHRFSTGP